MSDSLEGSWQYEAFEKTMQDSDFADKLSKDPAAALKSLGDSITDDEIEAIKTLLGDPTEAINLIDYVKDKLADGGAK